MNNERSYTVKNGSVKGVVCFEDAVTITMDDGKEHVIKTYKDTNLRIDDMVKSFKDLFTKYSASVEKRLSILEGMGYDGRYN